MRRNRFAVAAAVAALSVSTLVGCGSGAAEPDGGAKKDAEKDPTAGFVALKGDGFTLKLPSRTTRTERTVPTATGKVRAVLYTTGDDPDGTYLVALTAYPAGTVVDLDKALTGAAENIEGVVRENTTATYRGHDARNGRFTATASGTRITVFVRLIDLGGKLFQLQYAERGADVRKTPAEFAAVAASVRFSG